MAAALCGALLLPAALLAQSGNWEDYRTAGWSYSTANGAVNTITTAGQLAQFAYLVNSGTTFTGTTTRITANIDLSAHYWKPAGDYGRQFTGTLTAAPGVTISGMTINAVNVWDTGENAGGSAGLMVARVLAGASIPSPSPAPPSTSPIPIVEMRTWVLSWAGIMGQS